MQDTLVVAAAQINPELGQVAKNTELHRHWINEARRANVELLVFPELSLTGYGLGPSVLEVASHGDSDFLLDLAAEAGPMQTVVGFVEQISPGEYANALAVLQNGSVLVVHRKLNLPTHGGLEEGKWFTHGSALTRTSVNQNWSASHLICADLWNPGLVHAAVLQRPDILCAPINSASGIVSAEFSNENNWAVALGFYAMMYGLPIVMANRHGAEGDHHFWGGSRILGPRGELLTVAEDREMLVSAELSKSDIARARLDCPTLRNANTPLVQRLLC
ncbi:MAG: NAD+ synthetase [Natronospirillum sp.]|uniref:nitrilase-related carbon-nitrogen hydrolase n=1 Tax=Natronospirillum sp. TaxID=2812955 RepID=UPI0025D6E8DC|nr:nitrilase-related carbon-nitrogen hydrolase [Natronospirillum sp.]MCH8550369.1 NAD+ synthetase [Natronospirillum sp.]